LSPKQRPTRRQQDGDIHRIRFLSLQGLSIFSETVLDKLSTNGVGFVQLACFPFVLSSSKGAHPFSDSPLRRNDEAKAATELVGEAPRPPSAKGGLPRLH